MIEKGIAICEEKMILKFENFLDKYKLVQKTEEVKIDVTVDQTNNDVLSTSYLSPDDVCLTKSEHQYHQNSTYNLPVINFSDNSPNT